MFCTSTQYNFWNFKNEKEINEMRLKVNEDFINKFCLKPLNNSLTNPTKDDFLTLRDELQLVKYYEYCLTDFCDKFRDPRDERIKMPLNVSTTAHHYFKRFYLYNSVMDYHPEHILVTCVYLACKIEEFYVTITDFIFNIEGDRKKAADIILDNELQLTQELQFHLIIHHPYRPIEGLLIDIKTRYPALEDPERLRPHIEEFLERVQMTDAVLIFSPSQIALAAVTSAVSKLHENLDSYVTDILFKDNPQHIKVIIDAVRKIKRMIKNAEPRADENVIRKVESKLQNCRNQQNNPDSSQYRTNYTDWDDDELMPVQHNHDESLEIVSLMTSP